MSFTRGQRVFAKGIEGTWHPARFSEYVSARSINWPQADCHVLIVTTEHATMDWRRWPEEVRSEEEQAQATLMT